MHRFHQFPAIVATVLLLLGAVLGNGSSDDYCPDSGSSSPTSLITNYISADNRINGSTICRMEYLMPDTANLYQGMLAASQQHGENFTFETTLNLQYGHFVTTINGVTAPSNSGYFWALFAGNGVATSYGVDSLYPSDGDSFIWNYQYYNSSSPGIANYTGPCLNASSLAPSMPFTYEVAYLTVSSQNTANFTNGTGFMPVCRQIVLFESASSTLADVLATASEQVPLNISSTITNSVTVTTLNGLTNQAGFVWTPYNATSNTMLSRDLSATSLSNGDIIVFRFEEEEEEGSSATRMMTNVAIYGLVATVTAFFFA